MDDYKYLLDGKPISARGLIQTAKKYPMSYGIDGLLTTSCAARILRENGFKVMKPTIQSGE